MYARVWPGKKLEIGLLGSISSMTMDTSGTESAAANQKRRVISRSSGFSSGSSSVIARGSNAIPQIGHSPGSSRTISGCIGQVHSVRVTGAGATFGSSAIPHFGQSPEPTCSISGCMGQVKMASADPSTSCPSWCSCECS